MCLSMEAGKRKEASSQNKQSGALCAQLALDVPKSCAAAVGGSETAWGLLSLGPAEGGFLTPPVKDLGPLSRRGRLALLGVRLLC
ncbi:hypothetical protein Chor_004838 [Crotalus horridus]